MGKAGRPRIEFTEKMWDDFDKLCGIQCTLLEISQFFGVSEDTIERRVEETYSVKFAEHYKKKAAGGLISLRRKQYQTALSGNISMLIWLGKQYLGQRDKHDTTHEVTKGKLVIDLGEGNDSKSDDKKSSNETS